MVNDKMCVGVNKDDLMLRCEPDLTDKLLLKKGVILIREPFDHSYNPAQTFENNDSIQLFYERLKKCYFYILEFLSEQYRHL